MFRSVSNFIFLPVVCFLGLLIELISALTFYRINTRLRRQDKQHNRIYQYLFLYSISNIVVLFINLVYGVLDCGSFCHAFEVTYVNIYFIKQFERVAKIFMCNTFNTFNILIEFRIALDRYENLKDFKKLGHRSLSLSSYDKRLNKRKNVVYLTCLLFLLISIIINLPYIFIFKVETITTNATQTRIVLKPDLESISEHPVWIKPLTVSYFLKDSLCLLLICILNLIISIYLKNGISSLSIRIGGDQKISDYSLESPCETDTTRILRNNRPRRERNVFYMILLLCILLLVANLPEALYRMKRTLNVLFFTKFNYLRHYSNVSSILSVVCSYLKLFVYLFFSRTFLKQFKQHSFISSLISTTRSRIV